MAGCARPVAEALVLERALAEVRLAKATNEEIWFEERQRAIDNDLAAQTALRNYETVKQRYREASDEAKARPDDPQAAELLASLSKKLNAAGNRQRSANGAAINRSARAGRALDALTESREGCRRLEAAFPAAQRLVLSALARQGVRVNWDVMKMKLGPKFVQKLLASGRELEEAQRRHEENLAEIPLKLRPEPQRSPNPRGRRGGGRKNSRKRRRQKSRR